MVVVDLNSRPHDWSPMNWPPPAADIPKLPLEVLGLSLLRRIDREQPAIPRGRVVGDSGFVRSMGGDYGRLDVLNAVNEAWDWLFANGLMVNAGPTYRLTSDLEGYRIISRKGRALLESDDPIRLIQAEVLIGRPLHPRIEAKARIQFAIGAYGSAVLEAFKELEIRVRAAGKFPGNMVGDNLMRQAFNEQTGPLRDPALVPGERRAIMELYAGAMGAFKNPLSHRTVDFDDPTIAAEQLLFADLLHRMLDTYETLATNGTEPASG